MILSIAAAGMTSIGVFASLLFKGTAVASGALAAPAWLRFYGFPMYPLIATYNFVRTIEGLKDG